MGARESFSSRVAVWDTYDSEQHLTEPFTQHTNRMERTHVCASIGEEFVFVGHWLRFPCCWCTRLEYVLPFGGEKLLPLEFQIHEHTKDYASLTVYMAHTEEFARTI